MNRADRRGILKTFLLSLWGMATMVLLFVVILLVMEMMRQGQDPLRTLRPASAQPATPPPAPPLPALGTRDVLLYFAAKNGHALRPERREMEVSDSSHENCLRALEALAQGPGEEGVPVMPGELKVRALYLLEDGEMVIDFSRRAGTVQRRMRSVGIEALFVYGVVNTLTQSALQGSKDPTVRRVRFLIDGLPPQDSLPWHIDLREPIAPDQSWAEQTPDSGAHG